MGRRDLYLLIFLLLIGFVAAIFGMNNKNGSYFIVTVNGKEYGKYVLDEEQKIVIETELGYNSIVVADGKVYMEKADCPDQYCMKQRSVAKDGEAIVCLPHRLVVEVKDIGNSELDAVAE